MIVNLAVPENKYYQKLYSNEEYIKNNNIRILPMKEEQALELLLDSRIDAALISPLAYGSAVGKCDLRIIPSKLCIAENYTDAVSIYFKQGIVEILSATLPTNDSYISNIAQILLKEKYELFPKALFKNEFPDDFSSDILVSWFNSEEFQNKINLTEEWFDTFFNPLPMAMWVCKVEETPADLLEITNNLFKSENLTDDFYVQKPFKNDFYVQEGKIYWDWEKDFKLVLDNIVQILYFHQLLPELPEVKFYEGL